MNRVWKLAAVAALLVCIVVVARTSAIAASQSRAVPEQIDEDHEEFMIRGGAEPLSSFILQEGLLCALLGAMTAIRYIARKRRKMSNPRPSPLWYIPKVAGMVIIYFLGPGLFFAEGAYLDMVRNSPLPIWMMIFFGLGVGIFFWGYRVIWRPITVMNSNITRIPEAE